MHHDLLWVEPCKGHHACGHVNHAEGPCQQSMAGVTTAGLPSASMSYCSGHLQMMCDIARRPRTGTNGQQLVLMPQCISDHNYAASNRFSAADHACHPPAALHCNTAPTDCYLGQDALCRFHSHVVGCASCCLGRPVATNCTATTGSSIGECYQLVTRTRSVVTSTYLGVCSNPCTRVAAGHWNLTVHASSAVALLVCDMRSPPVWLTILLSAKSVTTAHPSPHPAAGTNILTHNMTITQA
jgi:hypothetical protein